MLTKEQILSADDLPREEVDVPEWGGSVFVRTMTGTERDGFEYDAQMRGAKRLENIRARLVVLTAVDDKGDRVFEDSDAIALGKKSAKALDRVFDVSSRLNKLSDRDVEELAKNSESGQVEGSTSD